MDVTEDFYYLDSKIKKERRHLHHHCWRRGQKLTCKESKHRSVSIPKLSEKTNQIVKENKIRIFHN